MRNTATLNMKPLAWKVLKREYGFDGVAVELTSSWVYPIIASSLKRHLTYTAAELRRRPQGMVEGKVYITDYDFRRYGFHLPIAVQTNISNTVCRQEMDHICRLVCAMHVFGGVSKRAAMMHYLAVYGYDFEDLNPEQLKKHYQRHFANIEKGYREDIQQIKMYETKQN